MADKIRKILSNPSLNAVTDAPQESAPEKSPDSLPKDEKEIGEQFECIDGVHSPIQPLNSTKLKIGDELEINEESLLNPLAAPESLENPQSGNVVVQGLGFVTNIAEFMVAADILITKAGPGTIAEATSLSLPVMLTSFLPGQEEGNVDFVVEGGFGSFIPDSDPPGIAETVANWLLDDDKLASMSKAAKAKGAPHAARDIVKVIGDISLKWKQINETRDKLDRQAAALMSGVSISSESS
jgi:glycosyltransferase involved in cell wall biosynthesis